MLFMLLIGLIILVVLNGLPRTHHNEDFAGDTIYTTLSPNRDLVRYSVLNLSNIQLNSTHMAICRCESLCFL